MDSTATLVLMTFTIVLTVLGAGAGVLLLAVMALVPFLEGLPHPDGAPEI